MKDQSNIKDNIKAEEFFQDDMWDIRVYKKPYGVFLPEEIWEYHELDVTEMKVWVDISRYKDGCYLSNETLGLSTDRTKGQVTKALENLYKKGLISIEKLANGKRVMYALIHWGASEEEE